jgi:peptidoglycan/LPS O-acetylase OafA/YrhL
LSVIALHTAEWTPNIVVLPGANLAVDFFFMLSGFVIDYAYTSRLEAGMSTWEFVKVRVIRLYPLIVVGALIGALVAAVSRVFTLGGEWKNVAALPLTALALPAPWGLQSPFRLNFPEWSLFFELVANLAFVLGLFRLSVRPLLALTVVLAAAYAWMGCSTGSVVHGQGTAGFSLGFIRVAFPFTTGMALNRLGPLNTRFKMPFWLASILLVASFIPDQWHEHQWLLETAIVLVLYPAIIYGALAIDPDGRWQRVASASAFISYPIYILHYPLLEAGYLTSQFTHMRWWVWVPTTTGLIVWIAWKAGVWDLHFRSFVNRWLRERRRQTTETVTTT